MSGKGQLLVVDDEPRMRQALSLLLQKWGYRVETASSGREALEKLADIHTDAVLTDLKMPGMEGDELLALIRKQHPNTPVILMTAFGTVKSAVEAMKAGAYDYILKPFDNEELRLTLQRAIEHHKLLEDNASLRKQLSNRYHPDNIIGGSKPIRDVLELVERVARTRATVLIEGESGTGKELIARAIHYHSSQAAGPFVAINCAALSESLLESELFGHERGAFTGAERSHRGKFEEADGGTLFLDEISETSNNFQTKLLRVLQEGEFVRVGGNQPIRVSVRILAATNRKLEQMVQDGKFRQDLFYRLRVVPITIPPLRKRRDDIPELARFFALRTSEDNGFPAKPVTDGAIKLLMQAQWRGNVRELENTIERAVILSRGERIEADDIWLPLERAEDAPALSASASSFSSSSAAGADGEGVPGAEDLLPGEAELAYGSMAPLLPPETPLNEYIDEMSRRHILRMLEIKGWRRQEAAESLGVDRATLYRMIKRLGLESAGPKSSPATPEV